MDKNWKDIFGKKTRLNWLESEVDILRREMDSYKRLTKNRIGTLEQQIADAMNREEEWKRRLAKIETGMIVDQMNVDGVWKEKPEFELEPRIGDLVVSLKNPTDIRKVVPNGFGLQLVGIREITVYNRDDLVKDFMSDWKVLVRREDIK